MKRLLIEIRPKINKPIFKNSNSNSLDPCYKIITNGKDDIVEICREHSNPLNEMTEVHFYFHSIRMIQSYLNHHPELKNSKIILPDLYQINSPELKDLMILFKDNTNIYIHTDVNEETVSLTEFVNVGNDIKKEAEVIKSHHNSPLENLMYVYDYVRRKPYQDVKNDESSIPRDLDSVIHGNHIVCVGYSNHFKALCDELSIPCRVYHLEPVNDDDYGHARNIVYLKDTKYDINGIYFCDCSWDSKKRKNDEYLNSYHYFMVTANQINDDNELNELQDNKVPLLKKYKHQPPELGSKDCAPSVILANHFREFMNQSSSKVLFPEDVPKNFNNILSYLERPVPDTIILSSFLKVRKDELKDHILLEDMKNKSLSKRYEWLRNHYKLITIFIKRYSEYLNNQFVKDYIKRNYPQAWDSISTRKIVSYYRGIYNENVKTQKLLRDISKS